MATTQKKQEIIAFLNDTDAFHTPAHLALRMSGTLSKEQRLLFEETEARETAIDCHKLLAQRAQESAGKVGRTAGAEFHKTVSQHAALLEESRGSSLFEFEKEFARLNLQVTMQNMMAVNDGFGKNIHEQVTERIHLPKQPQKRRWG